MFHVGTGVNVPMLITSTPISEFPTVWPPAVIAAPNFLRPVLLINCSAYGTRGSNFVFTRTLRRLSLSSSIQFISL